AAVVVTAVLATRNVVGPSVSLPMLLAAGLVAGVAAIAVLRRPVIEALSAIGRRAPVAQASVS
ncbi:MAG: hypothetical protein ACRC1J_01055, partial [Sandaracinobacteroides sp.]